jgi:hypothetical protein
LIVSRFSNHSLINGTGAGASSPPDPNGDTMSEPDRRVFMYKGKEARLFNSPDEVPEGWLDHPTDDAPAVADPVSIPAPETIETAPETDTELDALRIRAGELGITVDGRWSAKRLRRMIDEVEAPE